MEKTFLIYGGTVVTPRETIPANILIAGEKIQAILSPEDKPHADETFDATGLTILPGIIDAQVHFRDPGLTYKEDLETGSRAAAAGGVTSFLEMPNTKPATTTAQALADKKKRASEVSYVNYGFFIGATKDNLDVINSVPNVAGIKIFMGSSTGDLLVDTPEALEEIFKNGKRLIAVHAEDEAILKANKEKFRQATLHNHYAIRSPEAALTSTKLAVKLSQKYNRRLHILHLSSKEEVEFLSQNKPWQVTVEATPQHLLLSAPEIYDQKGTLAQMNPPIRTRDHRDALWQALEEGIIDMIATDHAPHTLEEKARPYGEAPSGMPGVETLLPVMLTEVAKGNATLDQIAMWLAERPAIVYSIENRGFLREGYFADLVIVDMNEKRTVKREQIYSRCGWSIWEGQELTGWPVLTMVNGGIVYHRGNFTLGSGKELTFRE